jgi:hypothetical protein
MMTDRYRKLQDEGSQLWRVHRARQIIRLEMLALSCLDPHVGYKKKSHHYYEYMFETKQKDEDVLEKKVDKILNLLEVRHTHDIDLRKMGHSLGLPHDDHAPSRNSRSSSRSMLPLSSQFQDAHAQSSSKSLPARLPSTADSPHQFANRFLARASSAPDGLAQPSSTPDQRRGSALVDYFASRSPDSRKGRKDGTPSVR